MKNPCVFVNIVDQTGRTSSLEISKNKIIIVGVLPHCREIEPLSVASADKLINWLNDWKKRRIAENELKKL